VCGWAGDGWVDGDGEMERWRDGEMERWRDGEMDEEERWWLIYE